jgi:menaquinone-dependent protoporphyrinogen oxidase
MAGILVLYGTSTGQTARIADRLARRIRDQGHLAECLDIRHLPRGFKPDVYEGILLGAPVRMMKFPRPVIRFVKRWRETLAERHAGFFAVCLAVADKRPESQQQVREWVGSFLKETGWEPAAQAVFAGALLYTKYGFITRAIMKKIAASEGRSTDTSRDHEYTDWEQVEKFADEYLSVLESQGST